MKTPRRKKIFFIIVTLLIMTIPLVFLELAIRNTSLPYNAKMSCQFFFNRTYNWPYGIGIRPEHEIPKLYRAYGREEQTLRVTKFSEDNGFITGPNRTSLDKANIWALGGSVMACTYLLADDSFSRVLERWLPEIRVANLGIPSNTSVNGIKILEWLLDKGHRPKIVIWAFGVNDSGCGPLEHPLQWWWKELLSRWLRRSELFWSITKQGGGPLPPGNVPERVPFKKYLEKTNQVIELGKKHNFVPVFLAETYSANHNEIKLFLHNKKVKKLRINNHKEFFRIWKKLPARTTEEDILKSQVYFSNVIRYQEELKILCSKKKQVFIDMNVNDDPLQPISNLYKTYPPLKRGTGGIGIKHDPIHRNAEGMFLSASHVAKQIAEQFQINLRANPEEARYDAQSRTEEIERHKECFSNLRLNKAKGYISIIVMVPGENTIESESLFFRDENDCLTPLKIEQSRILSEYWFTDWQTALMYPGGATMKIMSHIMDKKIVISEEDVGKLHILTNEFPELPIHINRVFVGLPLT